MPCRVAPQKIDESLRHGESAKDYVERLSREKAKVLWGILSICDNWSRYGCGRGRLNS